MVLTKNWETGGGAVTITYDGEGDGIISFSSDMNTGSARQMTVTVANEHGNSVELLVKQAGIVLPEGYTRLQWVGSRRTATNPYATTGIGQYERPNLGFSVRYRHHYTDATAYALIGQISSSSFYNNKLNIARGANDEFYVNWGQEQYPANEEDRPILPAETWARVGVNLWDSRKWTLDTDSVSTGGVLDGEIYENTKYGSYNNFSLAILGYNRVSRNIDVSEYMITRGSELVAWYFPALRVSDGVAGFYDVIRDIFTGPSSSTSTKYYFTAGPEWVEE